MIREQMQIADHIQEMARYATRIWSKFEQVDHPDSVN